MRLDGTKAVLVGGAGLVGSHIAERLLAMPSVGEVVIYDNLVRGRRENLERALADPRATLVEADIMDRDALASAVGGAGVVFHLAALWLLQCIEMPRQAVEVNVLGTYNVMEACRDAKVERVVYSSSASVYGDAVEIPMTEDHPFNNRTLYGATKIAGEQLFRAFHEMYRLPYVGLRYMNVYGPRQDYRGAYVAVIMKILDRIDRGLPPVIYGDGSQSYDFVYVEDVARANILAAESDRVDAFYNVGSGVRTTIKELTTLLLDIVGSSLEPVYEPQGQTFVTHRIGSTGKARAELGFESTTPLREGLERLVAWRREHIARAREAAGAAGQDARRA
jgi:UDP-glucose 4-epimerase